jgi:ABC-type nitrate/sulfonate/bicarbonate transport system permease component
MAGLARWRGWLLLALLLGWELLPRLGLTEPTLLPPLSRVLLRGGELVLEGRFLAHVAASLARVLAGLSIALALALPGGILLGLSPALQRLCAPVVSALRPLAPPAWIPLAMLWFGVGDAPALFIIAIGTSLTILVGTWAATRAVDDELVKVALTLGASQRQAIWYVILPLLLPSLVTQVRVGWGLAWMCVVAAEMVAVRHGLGFFMLEARSLFRTTDVLVGMITIAAIGMVSDHLLSLLERRLVA